MCVVTLTLTLLSRENNRQNKMSNVLQILVAVFQRRLATKTRKNLQTLFDKIESNYKTLIACVNF